MTVFKIEIDDRPVTEALNRLSAASRDLTPALRAVATALLSRVEDNFAAESGPMGKWPAVKDKKRRGGKILQDTGRLSASVTPFWSATEAGIGSNVIYAAIHQLGGQAGRGRLATIPARPYLPAFPDGRLQAGMEERVLEIVQDHLLNAT
ncbi:MAG: phage virion morphogenesis protein [Rhodocyclaceae bacterium]|nr:phage virion morphogenesis protein [Rhodocyclaceae bacterium]